MIMTKYDKVHAMAVSENNSISGMLRIKTRNRTAGCFYRKGQALTKLSL